MPWLLIGNGITVHVRTGLNLADDLAETVNQVDLALYQIDGLIVPVTFAEQVMTRQHLFNNDFFRHFPESLC
ncbi:MAG: hypothetical protein WBN81_03425 [Gammaproteobacteria bacterium]